MYGPRKYDHEDVKRTPITNISHRQKLARRRADELFDNLPEKVSHRIKNRKPKEKIINTKCLNGDEHGPAHLHVINVATGNETRFKLLEDKKGKHKAIPFYTGEERRNVLPESEIKAAQPYLDAACADFIQLWREMYLENALSGQVHRMNSDEGMEEVTDAEGRKARFPLPNGERGGASSTHKTRQQYRTGSSHNRRR